MAILNERIRSTDADSKVIAWQSALHTAIQWRNRFADTKMWEEYRQMYRMADYEPMIGDLRVGLPFAYVRSLVPQIYLRNPKVSITPRRTDDDELWIRARVLQRLDNWLIKETGLKHQYRRMIQDTFFCGFGAGILDYDSLHGINDKLTDDDGTLSLTQFNKRTGERIEFSTSVKPGMVWFKRVLPEDIIFPPKSVDSDTLEWFAYRVWRKLRDLKADPKYTNVSGVPTTANRTSGYPEAGYTSSYDTDFVTNAIQDPDDAWVELWHIHDARTGRVYTIVPGHPKFLRNDIDAVQIEGLPVEVLVFNDDPEYIYGVPDMRIIHPNIVELNDIRNQASKHRRLMIFKFLYKRGMISEEELARLTSSEVGVGAAIDSETASLGDVILPFNPVPSGILTELTLQADQVKGDIREAIGFSRTASGEFMGKTHISATETASVMKALDVRLDDRRNLLADSIERVIRKMNQIITTRWTQELVVDIVGKDGRKFVWRGRPSDLILEYDMNVVIYDAPPMDKETRLRMALEAVKAYAELNQGKIQQGAPIPLQLQRLIFEQFEETGLDIDSLLTDIQGVEQMINPQAAAMQGPPTPPVDTQQMET